MNFPKFVCEVSNRSGIRKEDVATILYAMRDVVVENTVENDEEINIPGFGKFITTRPRERRYYNARKGEIDNTLTQRVMFKPSVVVRRIIRKKMSSR